MRKRGILLFLFTVACWTVGGAYAEEAGLGQAEAGKDDFEPRWQVFFAAANLHPRLAESEGKISRLMDGRLGLLFATWERPETFKDWGENMKLWDFQLGVGRDLSPKVTAYMAVGATKGRQPNNQWYWSPVLGRPVGLDIDFERSLFFITTGLDYYFVGQPDLPTSEESSDNALMRRLKAARPYGEFAVGYINIKTLAAVSPKLPIRGKLFTYQDKARYDLFYWSPRLGIDVPLTQDDSLSFAVGYLFFTNHPTEFNNVSIYTIFRHRF